MFRGLLVSTALFSLPLISHSVPCGFEVDSYSVKLSSANRVPLLVEKRQFGREILISLKKRQEDAYKKYRKSIEFAAERCPREFAKIRKVVEKLLNQSRLGEHLGGEDGLELVVLCSRKEMDPVARIVAGKYLLAPASLADRKVSESAMASVLAHEITHFTLRHPARLMKEASSLTREMSEIKLKEIKRRHELEADLGSLQLLVNAGYDPRASVQHMKNIESALAARSRGLLQDDAGKKRTHEPLNERARLVSEQIEKCGYGVL